MKPCWLLCLCLLGCTQRVHEVGLRFASAEDGGEQLPWGRWAAQQAVPACPPLGAVLTVDTLADELEGGSGISDRAMAGERLSLIEALWIAHNRPGPDTILFEAQLFPLETPGTIVIQGLFSVPPSISEVCIDARNRGVIVYWDHGARSGLADRDETFLWGIGPGSLQVGLELRAVEKGLRVSAGGQIAGCRFFAEPGDFRHPISSMISMNGGQVGPGNVFSIPSTAVMSVFGSLGRASLIRENFMGFDPINGRNDPVERGLIVYGPSVVEDNVISSIFPAVLVAAGDLTFRRNWVGLVPVTLSHLEAPQKALEFGLGTKLAVVGPGNRIRAQLTGVEIDFTRVNGTIATVTQSTFYTPVPISYGSERAPLSSPTLTSAENAEVTGTCSEGGRIEVFSGAQGSPEEFLGAVDCPDAGPWVAGRLSVLPGRQLTATLTNPAGYTSTFSTPFLVPF